MKVGDLVIIRSKKTEKHGIVMGIRKDILGGSSIYSCGNKFYEPGISNSRKRSEILVASIDGSVFSWFDEENVTIHE
jgi:hypothetical protein